MDWGGFMLRTWLAQWIPEPEAVRAAEGWGGDGYAFLWPRSTKLGAQHLHHGVLILLTVWDEGPAEDVDAEARQFEQALASYVAARHPEAQCVASGQELSCQAQGAMLALVERRGSRVLMVDGLPAGSPCSLPTVAGSVWDAQED